MAHGVISGQAPYRYEARTSGKEFFAWLSVNRDHVEQQIALWGAVLFRGFGLAKQEMFGRLVHTMCGQVVGSFGLASELAAGRIDGPVPYPADRPVPFHNESYLASWPTRLVFACATAPAAGGETLLVDGRRVYRRLDDTVRTRLSQKGLLYVRNFVPRFGTSWQAFFGTANKARVARICSARGATWEWTRGDTLTVAQPARAVERNPRTGSASFLSQVLLYHPLFRRGELGDAGSDAVARQVRYGDGSAIEESLLWHVREIYESDASSLRWQEGDALVVDNIAVAHARSSFVGARKLLVGMGDPIRMRI
jgi:hypothetical protein